MQAINLKCFLNKNSHSKHKFQKQNEFHRQLIPKSLFKKLLKMIKRPKITTKVRGVKPLIERDTTVLATATDH